MVRKFAGEMEKHEQINSGKREKINREEFILLLSGISMFRRVPGIPVHMGYETLYHCETEEDKNQVRGHLKELFQVTDRETLIKACYDKYLCSRDYEQFMTFWCDCPMFDINELNENGLKGFTACKNLAYQFYPYVKERGFYAWDINERIGLCRTAVAGGVISEADFYELTDNWVKQAQVYYHSFEEYALSALCGCVYYMASSYPDTTEEELERFFNINQTILENLMSEEAPWTTKEWYRPKRREWAALIDTNAGCIVSKAAMNSNNIAYMYRDEPSENFPDTGWRFFVGDETEEYVSNPDNFEVCALNTVCNVDFTITSYIRADIGRRYGKNSKGEWKLE